MPHTPMYHPTYPPTHLPSHPPLSTSPQVRIAFVRLNPLHGSKYNKKELTPPPQCAEILLKEFVLPNAKRDTSAEFKAALAADAETQKVLSDHREQLQGWLRPILRKVRTGAPPNPPTY